jgi:hypothetical protein
MQLSPLPDIGSNRRLALAAALVTLVVCAALIWHDGDLGKTLGDTDDAMRLVLFRDLMGGRGWYDQWVARLQPPVGVYMHWSRLLDGGLAALSWLFRLARLSPAAAETATRMVWPLMWIYPAVVCALLIARRLAGSSAVFVCAVLLATNMPLYGQFRPGRIDHHNVQIVMTLIAAACAMAGERRARWAWLAGAAAALGLCIGVEALAFQALIGASYALRFGFDDQEAKPARNYGLALAGGGLLLYAIQTPPWRWSMAFCDSIGVNLVLALMIGGLGLAGVAHLGARWPVKARLAALIAIGLVAAGAYVAADPACLHGPFASVDPRLGPFWFDKIQELQSWSALWCDNRDRAIPTIIVAVMTLVAAGYLLFRERAWPRPATLLIFASIGVAVVAASHAYRLQDYVYWLGFPALAAAFSLLAARYLGGLLLPTLTAAILLSPVCVSLAATRLSHLASKPVAASQGGIDERCFDTAAYRPLAALPPGRVLAEIDLGPFILAHTRDSVLAAPYHRMAWGILAAHDALNAPSAAAEAKVRALKPDYLVDCPTNPLRVGPQSLMADLRKGRIPDWLQPLPAKGQVLSVYGLKPAPLSRQPSP